MTFGAFVKEWEDKYVQWRQKTRVPLWTFMVMH